MKASYHTYIPYRSHSVGGILYNKSSHVQPEMIFYAASLVLVVVIEMDISSQSMLH